MKKLLIVVLILILMSTPVFAANEVHSWYVNTWIREMNTDREAWNKETVLAYIKAMVNEGFVTEGDILKEFDATYVSTKVTPAPVKPTEKYASLEILDYNKGYCMTRAGGHYYAVGKVFDPKEEVYTHVLYKDNDIVYRFEDETMGIRGIVQVNGIIHVSTADAVYKYSGGKMTKITKSIPGYIHHSYSDGNKMYILCDDDSPGRWGSYLEGTYYEVSSSGTITPFKGGAVPVGFDYVGFAINKDGDRLARIPFLGSGVRVRRPDGVEYSQRTNERFNYYDEDYSVHNVIYYNNCLLANVKGSLVYYDNNNESHVLMGDMKASRLWLESYKCMPGDSYPIETGLGNEVSLGFVDYWTIGDDGYIYGTTMERWGVYHSFKLAIPETVKKVSTYKKTK